MSSQSESYRVELLGFSEPSREGAVASLMEAFGISEELARTYVAEAPLAVRSGVDGDTARAYAQALVAIGAEVRVVSEVTGEARDLGGLAGEEAAPEAASAAGDERSGRRGGVNPASSSGQAGVGEGARSEAAVPVRSGSRAAPEPGERTEACPACGFRQVPAAACERCGYTFPRRTPQVTSGEHEEVDVFANLRDSAEHQAVKARRQHEAEAKERLEAEKRRASFAHKPVRGETRLNPSRVILYVVLALLIVATLIFVLLTPPEDTGLEEIPDHVVPPPEGLHIRIQ